MTPRDHWGQRKGRSHGTQRGNGVRTVRPGGGGHRRPDAPRGGRRVGRGGGPTRHTVCGGQGADVMTMLDPSVQPLVMVAGLPGPERQYVPSRAFFARFPRGFAVYTRGHLHCRIDGKNQDRMREKVTIACQEFHRTLMHVLAYGPALNPGCVRRRTDASSGSRHHSPRRAQRRRNFRFRVGPSPDGVIQWLARTPGRQPQSSRRSE